MQRVGPVKSQELTPEAPLEIWDWGFQTAGAWDVKRSQLGGRAVSADGSVGATYGARNVSVSEEGYSRPLTLEPQDMSWRV